MTRPVIETCWKKTYLMPSLSMRWVIASICSRRPGWLRASSSVAGAGAIRLERSTESTVPPKVCPTLPFPSTTLISLSLLCSAQVAARLAAVNEFV